VDGGAAAGDAHLRVARQRPRGIGQLVVEVAADPIGRQAPDYEREDDEDDERQDGGGAREPPPDRAPRVPLA
jgi:hypothetical protein